MAAPDRRVRHLRLAATSEADVRHLLPRLEDAFRCANLSDAGGPLLLVRRLALGRLPSDASAQTLALLIERRVSAIGGTWQDGGDPAAERADYVRFASRFEARARLALRLARGQDAMAWYWRLAVPECRPEATAAENLRRMAHALASFPEARAALPAWATRLTEAGAAAALAAAIPDALGLTLLRQAGIAVAGHGAAPNRQTGTVRPHHPDLADDAPAWLHMALARGGPAGQAWTYCDPGHPNASPGPAAVPGANRPAPHGALRRPPVAQAIASTGALATGPEPGGRTIGTKAGQRADHAQVEPAPATSDTEVAHARTATLDARSLGGATASGVAPIHRAGGTGHAVGSTMPWWPPTAAGGLLFLLPLLARLGIADWSEQPGREDFPRRVLALAARRLRLAADDPAWAILATTPGNPRRRPPPAPDLWAVPLLAAPRARREAGELASALAAARRLDGQAMVFLTAARRWLRRTAHIGLADLVLRPARIGGTSTHVDVHFRLADCDIRVRRAGLDLDPGWLPWFGRVVAFHYDLPGAAT